MFAELLQVSEIHTLITRLMNCIGGLIAIGIFLMQWNPSQCLQHFEDLSAKVFQADLIKRKVSLSQRIQRIVRACVLDHRYNRSPIEQAFRLPMNSAEKMFNPLQNDIKVAVTATSVRRCTPCVITNYNGSSRPADSSMYPTQHV